MPHIVCASGSRFRSAFSTRWCWAMSSNAARQSQLPTPSGQPVESLLDEDDFAVIREEQGLPEGSAAPGSAPEAGSVPDTQEGTDGAPNV